MNALDALMNIGEQRVGTARDFARLHGCEAWPGPCALLDEYPTDDCPRCEARWRAVEDALYADSCDPPHQLQVPTDPPLLAGGQGRSVEEVADDAKTLSLVAGVAIGCALGLGVAWLWTVLA